MRVSDIDHSKVDSLDDFINVLTYGDPALIEIEGVLDQGRLLKHLSFLLSREPASDRGMDYNLFVFPGVEQFFVRLIMGLDDSLEALAGDVFQKGWVYVAEFIGSHDAQHVVRRLLDAIGMRFPRLQAEYDQHLDCLVTEFFTPTIGEFLETCSDSIDLLLTDFPTVYELFVTPLITSPFYRARRLFNFYCNPWIYNPVLEFLAQQDDLRCLSARRLGWLENQLGEIRPLASDESWNELTIKCRELLCQCGQLEPFANGCSGLLGEIKAAFYMAKNICRAGDTLIFLEDDNRSRKTKKRENCDLMIVHDNGQSVDLVEVKTKSPRHGVEDADAGTADNFFSNFSNAISSYLDYLAPRIGPIFGLNLGKVLPLFWSYEGSYYGTALPVVSDTPLQRGPFFEASPSKMTSEKKMEILLQALFMKPLILDPTCDSIGTDEFRLSERRQLTAGLFQKDWIDNVIHKAVDQLLVACERLAQEGRRVSTLYVALDLSLSYRLLQDPFSCSDGDIEAVAAEQLGVVFKPFKDQLAAQGYGLELILP